MATILALDGDENTLTCLQTVLEAFGHTVLPTSNREAALSVAKGLKFDLFMVDIDLEAVEAAELVAELAQTCPDSVLVAVSDYPKAAATLAVMNAGAHCLMRKPFEIGRILDLLEKACHDAR